MQSSDGRHERDVFVDVLRVLAVLIVVVGHWATTTVIWEEGRIGVENVLSVIPESHGATWLVQVMPLLFFVGGFANARSLARHGGEYLPYLRTRLVRLLTPTLAFMAIWLLVGIIAEALPLPDPNVVARAADLAALPFWFLGMYVVVVALAPLMWRLHQHFGWWVPALLIVGAAAVDVLVHGLGYAAVGVANYAFVWLLAHQLGFFYGEGRLNRVSGAFAGALFAAGLMALVVAVTFGGYPTSMVGVPGEDRWNTDPPSLPLVALTIALIGLALLARPRIQSWATRRHRLVDRLNSSTLTLYLWHVSALALAAAVVYPLGFPRPDTGSALWWTFRPVWLAVMVPFLALLVYSFHRFEVHPTPRLISRRSDHRVRLIAAATAVVSLSLGILGFGVSGFDRGVTEYGETVLAFSVNPLQNVLHVAVGLGLLGLVYLSAWILPGAAGASLLYLMLGAGGWSTGIGLLAINPATARLHVVLGSLGLCLLALAVVSDRRHAERDSPTGSTTS
ncbi:MAG: acyltransferase [Actinomycetota bacterium]|nr:acyltransferase [Actinomycetota bacterium]